MITISGLNSQLSTYVILTVQLWLAHSSSGDCVIQLYLQESFLTLSNRRGGSNSNVFNGTVFMDSAPISANAYPYLNNVVATPIKPEEYLGNYYNKNPNADWKLWINDAIPDGSGILKRFKLTIQGK